MRRLKSTTEQINKAIELHMSRIDLLIRATDPTAGSVSDHMKEIAVLNSLLGKDAERVCPADVEVAAREARANNTWRLDEIRS